jgi:hypothetical protein
MKFRYALVALALACNGDDTDKTGVTGDTADTTDTQTPGDCPDGTFSGPIAITATTVSCTGTTATFSATTEAVAAGGSVFAQETASEYAGGQWSENHPLDQTAADECGFSSELSRSITAAIGATGDVESGVSSLWTCEQLEDNAYMTFAFFALDGTGAVADCSAFGHDPAGMSSSAYTIVGQVPDYPTELAACEAGAEAR